MKTDAELMTIFAVLCNDPFLKTDEQFGAAVQKMGLTNDEVARTDELVQAEIKKIADALSSVVSKMTQLL